MNKKHITNTFKRIIKFINNKFPVSERIGHAMIWIIVSNIISIVLIMVMHYSLVWSLNKDFVDEEKSLVFGVWYILIIPAVVVITITRLHLEKNYTVKDNMIADSEYYKCAFNVIFFISAFMLLMNQYWKSNVIDIFWGNKFFWGIPLTTFFFRILLDYYLLVDKWDKVIITSKKINSERGECLVKVLEQTICSIVKLSNDGCYRYRLTRIWDADRKKATVIMLNPSKANELKTDRTVMNVSNFLIDNDFGGIDIVNLFAYMATDSSELSQREEKFEKENNEHILEAVTEADVVIIGWVRDKTSYIEKRKREVEEMLIPYKNKIKCFKDDKGKTPRHPRDLNDKWTLVEYDF